MSEIAYGSQAGVERLGGPLCGAWSPAPTTSLHWT